ncbi:MAG TPA: hypothetical protein VGD40_02585 [Chryseosolibacter sp.]
MVDRKKLKATTGLSLYKSMIRIEFGTMREFVDDINRFLTGETERVKKRIEDEIKESPELANEIVEYSIDDLVKYGEEFVGILLNSSLVAAYSLFEKSLVKICDLAEHEFNVSRSKLKGKISIIGRCKAYIQNDLKISLSDLDASWDKIEQYREVRNLITHEDSRIKKVKGQTIEQNKLYPYFDSQKKNISLKHSGKFYISNHAYINEFCNLGESYLNDVISRVKSQSTQSSKI